MQGEESSLEFMRTMRTGPPLLRYGRPRSHSPIHTQVTQADLGGLVWPQFPLRGEKSSQKHKQSFGDCVIFGSNGPVYEWIIQDPCDLQSTPDTPLPSMPQVRGDCTY